MSGSTTAAAPSAAAVRAAILSTAQTVIQPVSGGPQTYASPGNASPLIAPIRVRNVGLLKRVMVRVGVTFTTPAGTTLTRTNFGGANLVSNFALTDLNNLSRINTTGWHLHLVNSIKRRRPFSAALSSSALGCSVGYGNVLGAFVDNTPSSIVGAGQTTTLYFVYELPVMYTDTDFRGAIYMGTTQASLSVQATINNVGMFAAAGSDATGAVFSVNAGGGQPTITNVNVSSYQIYFDQLPTGSNGVVALPLADMSSIYQLATQTQSGMLAANDFAIPFVNLRSYLSTIVAYDNGGVMNAGTDVNYFKLSAANLYTYFQMEPWMIAERTRNEIGTDMPAGVYYFPSRNKPISTQRAGNIELYANLSSVTAGATMLVGYEFFATALTLQGSGLQ